MFRILSEGQAKKSSAASILDQVSLVQILYDGVVFIAARSSNLGIICCEL
jgi:hypothetical protein